MRNLAFFSILPIAAALLLQGCKEDESSVCECMRADSIVYGFDSSFVPLRDTVVILADTVVYAHVGNPIDFRMPAGPWQSATWTPATGLSCTNCFEPTATPNASIDYTLTLLDTSGGVHTYNIYVRINGDSTNPVTLYVPNIFTPDGNAWNDRFQVNTVNERTFHLVIKDGNSIVFEAHDQYTYWDGTVNGNRPTDCNNYTYTVDVTFNNGETARATGVVTLFLNDGNCPEGLPHCRFGSQFDGVGYNPNLPIEPLDC